MRRPFLERRLPPPPPPLSRCARPPPSPPLLDDGRRRVDVHAERRHLRRPQPCRSAAAIPFSRRPVCPAVRPRPRSLGTSWTAASAAALPSLASAAQRRPVPPARPSGSRRRWHEPYIPERAVFSAGVASSKQSTTPPPAGEHSLDGHLTCTAMPLPGHAVAGPCHAVAGPVGHERPRNHLPPLWSWTRGCGIRRGWRQRRRPASAKSPPPRRRRRG